MRRNSFSISAMFGLVVLVSIPVEAALLRSSGKVTMLRVHDVGTRYGPPTDQINVEVVIQLDSQPGKAFGFQLRNDNNRAARQGMLDLLRDAFNNDWKATIVYDIEPNKNNGVIVRVWLTKPTPIKIPEDALARDP